MLRLLFKQKDISNSLLYDSVLDKLVIVIISLVREEWVRGNGEIRYAGRHEIVMYSAIRNSSANSVNQTSDVSRWIS